MHAGTFTCSPYPRSTSRAHPIRLRYRPRGIRSSSGLIVIAIIGSGTRIERFGAGFDMGLEAIRSDPSQASARWGIRSTEHWGLN